MQVSKIYSAFYSFHVAAINSFSHSPVRCFHVSVLNQGSSPRRPTRFEKICALNKTLYIHRNTEMGPRPIFYRGPRKVDLWQRYLDKKKQLEDWRTFSRQPDLQENPVDDVYLVNLYKPNPVPLKEALHRLKEYTLLDLTDQDSDVILRVGVLEIFRGKGKRKKALTFFKSTNFPHPQTKLNNVCVFTNDPAMSETALELGACGAGGSDLITKILNNNLICDAFFTTPDYLKDVLLNHSDLKIKLGKFMPSKVFGLLENVTEIVPFIKESIYHNFDDNKQCKLSIGKIQDPVEALEENAKHVIERILEIGDDDNYVTSASVSCYTEPIPLDLTQVIDYDDV